jgi:hypothetical protein
MDDELCSEGGEGPLSGPGRRRDSVVGATDHGVSAPEWTRTIGVTLGADCEIALWSLTTVFLQHGCDDGVSPQWPAMLLQHARSAGVSVPIGSKHRMVGRAVQSTSRPSIIPERTVAIRKSVTPLFNIRSDMSLTPRDHLSEQVRMAIGTDKIPFGGASVGCEQQSEPRA